MIRDKEQRVGIRDKGLREKRKEKREKGKGIRDKG